MKERETYSTHTERMRKGKSWSALVNVLDVAFEKEEKSLI